MEKSRQFHDLCRLRSTVEAFAVDCWRKSANRTETEKKLNGMVDQLQVSAKKGDYSEFHRIDNQLHRILVESAGLPSLVKCWEAVVDDLDSWIFEVKETYWPNLMALYQEHVLLLEAWGSKDDWVASAATHQHLEAGWYRIAMVQGADLTEIDAIDRANAFISTHFESSLDMEWVARHVSFLSVSHFNRLFRDRTGLSPYQYLKQIRLNRAAQILKSGSEPVSEVAKQTGYSNTSHFVRDFRKKFNVTPLVYRRESAG
jgi:AraC-like DNA-binding protein